MTTEAGDLKTAPRLKDSGLSSDKIQPDEIFKCLLQNSHQVRKIGDQVLSGADGSFDLL